MPPAAPAASPAPASPAAARPAAPGPPATTRAGGAGDPAAFLNLEIKTERQRAEAAQVLRRWVAEDPAAAAAWLRASGQAGEHSPALRQLVAALAASGEFADALEWANAITDSGERLDAFEEIFAEAFRRQAVSAPEVEASGLPPERVSAILSGARLD